MLCGTFDRHSLPRAVLSIGPDRGKDKKKMTLEQIRTSGKEVLTCRDVSEVLGADPGTLHQQAMDCPERLGFPVIVISRRVKIPRLAFIRFMEGGQYEAN